MSRVSVLEKIMGKRNSQSALDFDWNKLWVPPIMSLFTPDDINELVRIATSLKYSGNIDKKYKLIDDVMRRRGFIKSHSGTNRVVYRFLESPLFVAKVAVDKIGLTDSPAEFANQKFLQPFCCKIFEVHPSGVIAFVERVNPISSLDEFMSISEDVFNMLLIKIMGKYIFDDLGTRSFMNFGVRDNSLGCSFGPVVIDFPYVYELDGAKLTCKNTITNPVTGLKEICNGEIDYKSGFNGLECVKCHHEYTAKELSKDSSNVYFEWDDDNEYKFKHIVQLSRAKVICGSKILLDSGRSSKTYISKEDYLAMGKYDIPYTGTFDVVNTVHEKHKPNQQVRYEQQNALVMQYYKNLNDYKMREESKIKNLIKTDSEPEVTEVIKETKLPYKPLFNYKEDTRFKPEENDDLGYTVTEVINSEEPQDIIKKLESQTFPEIEMNDKIELSKSQELVSSSSNNNLVASKVDNLPTQIYSDEQMKQIIEENIARNAEKVAENYDANIIDPQQDLETTQNPINRPYPTADKEIFVGNKQSPQIDTSKVSKVIYNQQQALDNESIEDVLQYNMDYTDLPNKNVGRERYKNKRKYDRKDY